MCLPIRLPANGLLSLTHVFLFLFTKFKLRDAQFAWAYIYRYFLCTMIGHQCIILYYYLLGHTILEIIAKRDERYPQTEKNDPLSELRLRRHSATVHYSASTHVSAHVTTESIP